MNKRKAIYITIAVFILGFALNFLFGIMPDDFKDSISSFTESLGLSYTLFWILCTILIAAILLFFVWQQESKSETINTPIRSTKKTRIIEQGKGSLYVENNKGPINMNN